MVKFLEIAIHHTIQNSIAIAQGELIPCNTKGAESIGVNPYHVVLKAAIAYSESTASSTASRIDTVPKPDERTKVQVGHWARHTDG